MKRSAQIALVVMAASGIGATSYALMPREDCGQIPPGVMQSDTCRSARGSTGHGGSSYGWSRTSLSSQAGSTSTALVGGTERGGFGSSGRGFGAHSSGA